MVENNIKYLNDSDNREFIDIYEDEIKRLIKKNEDLHASIEKREQNIHTLQHEKALMQRDLEQVNSLCVSMEQLKKQNVLYKEKFESLNKEKVNLTHIIDGLRENTLKQEDSNELSTKLEIEKQKVVSLQDQLKRKDGQLNALIKDKNKNSALVENQAEFVELKANNEAMKKLLTEEKAELAEILLEARMQSKNLIDKATKESEEIKEAANQVITEAGEKANQVIVDAREKAKLMGTLLDKIKNESNQFASNLIEEVDNILK